MGIDLRRDCCGIAARSRRIRRRLGSPTLTRSTCLGYYRLSPPIQFPLHYTVLVSLRVRSLASTIILLGEARSCGGRLPGGKDEHSELSVELRMRRPVGPPHRGRIRRDPSHGSARSPSWWPRSRPERPADSGRRAGSRRRPARGFGKHQRDAGRSGRPLRIGAAAPAAGLDWRPPPTWWALGVLKGGCSTRLRAGRAMICSW